MNALASVIECKICGVYNDKMCLPCGHSVCFSCFHKESNMMSCSKGCPFAPRKIGDLKNYTTNRDLNELKNLLIAYNQHSKSHIASAPALKTYEACECHPYVHKSYLCGTCNDRELICLFCFGDNHIGHVLLSDVVKGKKPTNNSDQTSSSQSKSHKKSTSSTSKSASVTINKDKDNNDSDSESRSESDNENEKQLWPSPPNKSTSKLAQSTTSTTVVNTVSNSSAPLFAGRNSSVPSNKNGASSVTAVAGQKRQISATSTNANTKNNVSNKSGRKDGDSNITNSISNSNNMSKSSKPDSRNTVPNTTKTNSNGGAAAVKSKSNITATANNAPSRRSSSTSAQSTSATSGPSPEFMENYSLLLVFRDEHGHFDIPNNYVTTNPQSDHPHRQIQLGKWSASQKSNYSKLRNGEQRQLLDALRQVGLWSTSGKRGARRNTTNSSHTLDNVHELDRQNKGEIGSESDSERDSHGSNSIGDSESDSVPQSNSENESDRDGNKNRRNSGSGDNSRRHVNNSNNSSKINHNDSKCTAKTNNNKGNNRDGHSVHSKSYKNVHNVRDADSDSGEECSYNDKELSKLAQKPSVAANNANRTTTVSTTNHHNNHRTGYTDSLQPSKSTTANKQPQPIFAAAAAQIAKSATNAPSAPTALSQPKTVTTSPITTVYSKATVRMSSNVGIVDGDDQGVGDGEEDEVNWMNYHTKQLQSSGTGAGAISGCANSGSVGSVIGGDAQSSGNNGTANKLFTVEEAESENSIVLNSTVNNVQVTPTISAAASGAQNSAEMTTGDAASDTTTTETANNSSDRNFAHDNELMASDGVYIKQEIKTEPLSANPYTRVEQLVDREQIGSGSYVAFAYMDGNCTTEEGDDVTYKLGIGKVSHYIGDDTWQLECLMSEVTDISELTQLQKQQLYYRDLSKVGQVTLSSVLATGVEMNQVAAPSGTNTVGSDGSSDGNGSGRFELTSQSKLLVDGF